MSINMTYFNTTYKFGRRSKSAIDAISTTALEAGDNVFNTDINKEEFWTGSNWVNDDCIIAVNTSGGTLSEGHIVGINTSLTSATVASCQKSSTSNDTRTVGVIYRGGINGANVVIAVKGYYKVMFTTATTSVTRQHILSLSSTAGEGTTTSSKFGSTSTMGVIAESYVTMPVDRLVYCWISSPEVY